MSSELRLHPEHGVNPTVGVCWWCGEDDGTVALLGAAYKGEAPRRMVVSPDPCPACQEKMAQGITLIEATEYQRDERQVELHPGVFATGRWIVVTEDAVERQFKPPELVADVLAKRKAFMPPEVFDACLPTEINA